MFLVLNVLVLSAVTTKFGGWLKSPSTLPTVISSPTGWQRRLQACTLWSAAGKPGIYSCLITTHSRMTAAAVYLRERCTVAKTFISTQFG